MTVFVLLLIDWKNIEKYSISIPWQYITCSIKFPKWTNKMLAFVHNLIYQLYIAKSILENNTLVLVKYIRHWERYIQSKKCIFPCLNLSFMFYWSATAFRDILRMKWIYITNPTQKQQLREPQFLHSVPWQKMIRLYCISKDMIFGYKLWQLRHYQDTDYHGWGLFGNVYWCGTHFILEYI